MPAATPQQGLDDLYLAVVNAEIAHGDGIFDPEVTDVSPIAETTVSPDVYDELRALSLPEADWYLLHTGDDKWAYPMNEWNNSDPVTGIVNHLDDDHDTAYARLTTGFRGYADIVYHYTTDDEDTPILGDWIDYLIDHGDTTFWTTVRSHAAEKHPKLVGSYEPVTDDTIRDIVQPRLQDLVDAKMRSGL